MGRVGASQPTDAVLEFNADHALARDAIHKALDTSEFCKELEVHGFHSLTAQSQACDRSTYLRRPDLGRLLSPDCIEALTRTDTASKSTLTVVVADGLSALAPALHALPLLERLRQGLKSWELDAVVVATQARVALGDEIGQLRRAEASLVLIGERPGLRSADSLGAYLTYAPRPGRMDSERNCISNIRPNGLTYGEAVFRLLHLLDEARTLGMSGVALKDESESSRRLKGTIPHKP
jgi:ethanolamine ammonia-lyase small subunit